MEQAMDVRRLDLKALAQAGRTVAGCVPLTRLGRLCEESSDPQPGREVEWSATGESRAQEGGGPQVWLHLRARAVLDQICQRCLGPVRSELQVGRSFRFVADETQAALEDEAAEEDVLVLERAFDLMNLIEDELLMALPLVPRHEACPDPVPMSVQDPDFETAAPERPNPFASLATLKGMSGD